MFGDPPSAVAVQKARELGLLESLLAALVGTAEVLPATSPVTMAQVANNALDVATLSCTSQEAHESDVLAIVLKAAQDLVSATDEGKIDARGAEQTSLAVAQMGRSLRKLLVRHPVRCSVCLSVREVTRVWNSREKGDAFED